MNDCHSNEEPLGYQHFLYDVNIEYNLGGTRSQSGSNCLSFKLKCLPYMIDKDHQPMCRKSSLNSSGSSTCDESAPHESSPSSPMLDVAEETCAFLGNSDYVPSQNRARRRVVLEIISAKLSQPASSNNVHPADRSRLIAPSLVATDTSFRIPISPARHRANIVPPINSSPSLTNRRFVNYTLLIKTLPGLDRRPAVIERRFSDFLFLYQGLKAKRCFAAVVDKHVSFPRKVYMGNFSLHNIAERSVEFSRLLNLCMTNTGIMWSKPFVSFILDKELKEAHRLSLSGNLDDLQALIEIPHRIVQKLFLKSSDHPSILPRTDNTTLLSNDTLSSNQSYSEMSVQSISSNSTATLSESACDTNCVVNNYSHIKGVSPSLNERILVIFCLLFFTYFQSENYAELKQTILEFSSLISSDAYLNSLTSPRHYVPLRACLLFLMDQNEGSIMNESQRAWFEKKLEDLEDSHRSTVPFSETSSSSSNARVGTYKLQSHSAESMVKALRGFDWNLASDTLNM